MKISVLAVSAALGVSAVYMRAEAAGQASSQAARSAVATPAGNAETGKRLFTRNGCYECHGLQAQGSTATGPRLGPDPISFSAFAAYIRKPKGEMPPYTTKVTSEQDLSDIYAFLKSLPHPPDPKTLPLPK